MDLNVLQYGGATIVCSAIGSYVASRVAVAVLQSEMKALIKEVASLRRAKHRHSSFITQHHLRLNSLDHKGDSGLEHLNDDDNE